jgi:hypothetical protein
MYRIIIVLLILIPFVCSCDEKQIKDFESDGCTLFPDSSLIDKTDWCDCCFDHDIAYWQGGTEAERLKADEALRECVREKTGNENLAKVKYKELTDEEKTQVESKLKEYYSGNSERPCK